MNKDDPIRRVSVISTGAVQIHPEHMACTWQPTWLWVLTSRRWTAPRPINVYVIEHRDGLVLFDTGQDRASITDPGYFPTGPLMGPLYRMARFEMAVDQTLSALLAGLGYNAGDVGTAIVSHLHGDHIGGLREFGRAELLVSPAEWDTLSGVWPELLGVMCKHIKLPGLRWREIEPRPLRDPALAPFDTGHDLFGDGSLVMVPTPGHTPGSSSLIVRRPGRPTLALVGDLTYEARLLACGHVPGVGNPRVLRRFTAMINQLRQADRGAGRVGRTRPGCGGRDDRSNCRPSDRRAGATDPRDIARIRFFVMQTTLPRRFSMMARLGLTISVLAVLLCAPVAVAQTAGSPMGVWLTQAGDAKVRVSKCGEAICGVVVWLREPLNPATGQPMVDDKNPNPALAKRPMIGLPLFHNMRISGPNKWSGQIYNADDGGTYVSNISVSGPDTLRVEGCVGMMCGSENWTRSGR